MSGERTERAKYQLRSLPPKDYCRQLRGLLISREAIHTAATRETNQREEGTVEGMDQLLQLLADQLQQQQEDRQQQQEEHQQEREEQRRREQQEKEEQNILCRFVEREVNGQRVARIQLDSGASRTIVNRSLISPKDIEEKCIVVTFGNSTSGEYPLATINVKIDHEECRLEAVVIPNLVEEVLLGRDVPLCKHLVKRLPRKEQMELLRQLAGDKNKIQLEETPRTMTVLWQL